MLTLTECTRPNTCYDCTDPYCAHHGDKGADCPKYRCDRPEPFTLDCEHCAFVDRHIEDERRFYKTMIFGYCKIANTTTPTQISVIARALAALTWK